MNVTLRMLVGGFAALAAWAIIEPSNPGITSEVAWGQFEVRLILAWGALIGLAVGGFNGYMQGGRVHLIRGLLLGLVLGAIGAPLGYNVGGKLEEAIFGPLNQIQITGNFAQLVLARTVAIMPLGVFLGTGIGVSALDYRRVIHGAIGGAIGAGIGAMLFDLIGLVMAPAALAVNGAQPGQVGETGQVSRAILSLCMGGLIGLFIGLVEQIARQAWVRQALGRNEGREWPLFGSRTLIGRNETAQIPIFGDPAVSPAHAFIDRNGHEYWLSDAGSGAPTYLNGQLVASAPLVHGSQIQVGNTVLQFLLKGGQAVVPAGPNPGYPRPQVPMQPQPTYAPAPAQPVPQPSYSPTLVAIDGPMVGQRFPIQQTLEIGREGSGVKVAFDTSASRRHAMVSLTPQGIVVTDLGSTNGTYVNGQRITAATMNPGDLVRIGVTTFRLE